MGSRPYIRKKSTVSADNGLIRREQYYDAILNGTTDKLPAPVTREDAYLFAIAKKGGGGGGAEDAVKYTEQDLTEAQKAQARENIGAGTNRVIGVYENENIKLHC